MSEDMQYESVQGDKAQFDSPLDKGDQHSSIGIQADPALVNAVFNEVLRRMKGKATATDEVVFGNKLGSVNFAGIVSNALLTSTQGSGATTWIVDSGATDHFCCNRDLFTHLSMLPQSIIIGLPDGTTQIVRQSGVVILNKSLVLKRVLYMPSFKHNLLSVPQLLNNDKLVFVFHTRFCNLQDLTTNQVLAYGRTDGSLYKFNSQVQSPQLSVSTQDDGNLPNKVVSHTVYHVNDDIHLQHARLGHLSLSKMRHLPYCKSGSWKHYDYNICIQAKLHKQPFNRSSSIAMKPFDLVHMDL